MNTTKTATPLLSRRSFLGKVCTAGAGLALLGAPDIVRAAMLTPKRTLAFYHTHTGEELELSYTVGRIYNFVALSRINQYLGDFRTGEVHAIDTRLLDILWALQVRSGRPGVFSVISAFRSPQTNAYLRGRGGKSSGVAKKSLHMEGRAIDVRFSELPTAELRDCAIELEAGGVGFYPNSDFVHLDTGAFRTW